MKLIIDIPKEIIKDAKDSPNYYPTHLFEMIWKAVVNGIPYEDRPQGKWIIQRHDMAGCFYTCSNCGRMIRVPLFIDDPEDNETLADYPFCHCGAKMQEGSAK